jgi:hypothetical protein
MGAYTGVTHYTCMLPPHRRTNAGQRREGQGRANGTGGVGGGALSTHNRHRKHAPPLTVWVSVVLPALSSPTTSSVYWPSGAAATLFFLPPPEQVQPMAQCTLNGVTLQYTPTVTPGPPSRVPPLQ